MSVTLNSAMDIADLHFLAVDVQSGQEAAVHRDLCNCFRFFDLLCSHQVEAFNLVVELITYVSVWD